MILIDIHFPRAKPILIGICYRPPKDSMFYDELEEALISSGSTERETIIIGDLNTDVGDITVPTYKDYSKFSKCLGLTQIITEPTRVTEKTATTIDLILVTDKKNISQSGVIKYGLSDHYLIHCTRKKYREKFSGHKTIRGRSFKNYSEEKFRAELEKENWDKVIQANEVNEAWSTFKSKFSKIADSMAPSREVRVKQRTNPWFDSSILELIRLRDMARVRWKKNKDQADFITFKKYRNQTRETIRQAKRDYYSNAIKENSSDTTKLWKILKNLGCGGETKNKGNEANIGLNNNGCIEFDKRKVATIFNNYFSSVARDLVTKLPDRTNEYGGDFVTEYYEKLGVKASSFSLVKVTTEKVTKMLQELNVKKATGLDGISARLLRDAAVVIAPYATHIINLSLDQGKVPTDFKNARVTPIHKKGSKSDPSNYRPVSILNVISKVVEKIVHDQIYDYMTDKNLLYEFQSGFRKSCSTETCLLYLTDQIRKEVDSGKMCGLVLLDLQKAFDTVSHEILLAKMKAIL